MSSASSVPLTRTFLRDAVIVSVSTDVSFGGVCGRLWVVFAWLTLGIMACHNQFFGWGNLCLPWPGPPYVPINLWHQNASKKTISLPPILDPNWLVKVWFGSILGLIIGEGSFSFLWCMTLNKKNKFFPNSTASNQPYHCTAPYDITFQWHQTPLEHHNFSLHKSAILFWPCKCSFRCQKFIGIIGGPRLPHPLLHSRNFGLYTLSAHHPI